MCGSSRSSAEAFVERHRDEAPRCRPADGVADVVADPEIDMIIVATPPDARVAVVDAAATAGLPILVEKPLERSLAAATEIVETCASASVPLGVMLQHRASRAATALRRWQAGDELGELLAVEIAVPWWRPQRYYDETGRGTYARDGGGVLITQAIHTIDLALSFAGPVRAVTAMTATSGFHTMEAEDLAVVGLEFASGAVGSLMATTAAYPGRPESIRLHHERASALLRSNELVIERHDGRTERVGEAGATGSGADPMAFGPDLHRAVILDFVDAVEQRRPPLVSGADALAVHRLIDAIETSGRQGRREELSA